MPRPDGTLYNFERTALKPKPEPKKKEKPVVVAPAEPDVPRQASGHKIHPLHPLVYNGGKGGRPVVRKRATVEMVDAICKNIREGLPEESALVLAGITKNGIERWKKMNPAVQQAFDAAEAEWERNLVRLITSKAPADHKAATWLLERRAAQRWAPVTKQELTGRNGGAIQHHTLSQVLLASVGGGADRGEPKPVSSAVDS